MKKYLGLIVTLVIFIIGVLVVVGSYREKVDVHEVKIEKHDGKIEELSEYSIKQTMALERVQEKAVEQQQQMIQQVQQVQDFQEINMRQLGIIEKLEERVK